MNVIRKDLAQSDEISPMATITYKFSIYIWSMSIGNYVEKVSKRGIIGREECSNEVGRGKPVTAKVLRARRKR